jgi:hypothetical protein
MPSFARAQTILGQVASHRTANGHPALLVLTMGFRSVFSAVFYPIGRRICRGACDWPRDASVARLGA